jgi:hypothetical protein
LSLHSRKKLIKKNETPYVKSGDQLIDIFTKGLDPKSFQKNKDKLGMIDVFFPR